MQQFRKWTDESSVIPWLTCYRVTNLETSFNRNSWSWSACKEQRRIDFREGVALLLSTCSPCGYVVHSTLNKGSFQVSSHQSPYIDQLERCSAHSLSAIQTVSFNFCSKFVRFIQLVAKMPIECLQPTRWVSGRWSKSAVGWWHWMSMESVGHSWFQLSVGLDNHSAIFRLPKPAPLSVLPSLVAFAMSCLFQKAQ